jgi:hypothetical protein
MKIKNKALRRTVWTLFWTIIVVPVILILFISPLTKYLVEKYDVKYTGREIKMDWAYVNPFTGYVYFSNLKIYESKSDSTFFSTNSVSANFSMRKLFSKTYEIEELTLNKPRGIIIQDKKNLNLDDLIEKFSSSDHKDKPGAPVKFSILSIIINDGEIYYREITTPVNIFITKLDLESTGIRWNSDTIAAKFSFLSGTGNGNMNGDFTINTNNLDYSLAAIIKNLNLDFINQYLAGLSNSGKFRASLDGNFKAAGNLNDAEELDANGKIIVSQFHFGRDTIDDFASFDKLVIDINQLNPKGHKYSFDSLLLDHPYFKYEAYDYLDNVETMFGEKGALVTAAQSNPEKFNLVLEIGKYIKLISRNFFSSDYQVNRLAISNGDMQYNDYSMNEKFSLSASPLFVTADSIDKKHKRVALTFKSEVQPYGTASLFLSINPNDSSDFDMNYHFEKFPVSMFNPYLVTYTSFPLDRGTLEMNGQWSVRNGFIQSTNHLLVIDPRVSKRIRKQDSKWIPLPLIMAFVRERGNVIDYEIPITGDIKNPAFHLKDVFADLVKNIFIKPPTTPYRFEVRSTEKEVEQSVNVKWEMRQDVLGPHQEKFIHKMADFLEETPAASIDVYPTEYAEKEKEFILFFEAKKKYFLLMNGGKSFTGKDSIEIDRTQIKDSLFVDYLNKLCHDSMLNTIQQKCNRFLGAGFVDLKFNQLENKRNEAFRYYFKLNGTNDRVHIHSSKEEIPYNGFSYFKIKYNSEIPKSLADAYLKMEKLNSEAPRIRYFRLRKKENVVPGIRNNSLQNKKT